MLRSPNTDIYPHTASGSPQPTPPSQAFVCCGDGVFEGKTQGNGADWKQEIPELGATHMPTGILTKQEMWPAWRLLYQQTLALSISQWLNSVLESILDNEDVWLLLWKLHNP